MVKPIPHLIEESGPRESAPRGAIPVAMYGDMAGAGEPGKSAYQEWLDSGGVGSEAAFLASLIGPAGPKGDPGSDGSDGDPGPRGATGAQGVQGPRGASGEDGRSVDIKEYVQAQADLPDLTGQPSGPAYLVMDTGHLFFWNGSAYTDGGQIRGLRGSDGEPGAQGPAGADGQPGAPGPRGDTGPQGIRGEQGVPGERGPEGPGVPSGGGVGAVLTRAPGGTEWASPELNSDGTLRVGHSVGVHFAPSSNSVHGNLVIPGLGVEFSITRLSTTDMQVGVRSPSGPAVAITSQLVKLGATTALEGKNITPGGTISLYSTVVFGNSVNGRHGILDFSVSSGAFMGHAYQVRVYIGSTLTAYISAMRMA